jgi:DNA-binding HxlR family transcriptional regulator
MLQVSKRLEEWLKMAPTGPVPPESGAAKGIVKAMVDGWCSKITSSLAAEPMSLTDLDRKIPELSYPALERRLSNMRMAGLVESLPTTPTGTPYTLTDWARRGVKPLAAASRCERVHMGSQAPPVTEEDIEGTLLLATTLVDLPAQESGLCQLEVEAEDRQRDPTGIRVEVQRGRVVACERGLAEERPTFATGTPARWFTAVKDGSLDELRFGGGRRLAESLVLAMHVTLMGVQ